MVHDIPNCWDGKHSANVDLSIINKIHDVSEEKTENLEFFSQIEI